MVKRVKKIRLIEQEEVKEEEVGSETDSEDDSETDDEETPTQKNGAPSESRKKTRVLVLCSRGSDYRIRHLMKDLIAFLPHSKTDSKLDKKTKLPEVNEIAESNACDKVLYFENRKHMDHYLWMANSPDGPTVKFLVRNIHTMDELKLTGNCLKGSRNILSFDSTFDSRPHLALIKETLKQTFATPNKHPRSKPFFDHLFTFSLGSGNLIYVRCFQFIDDTLQLQEIGPRFALEVIRIFQGSFEGAVLYDNPDYESPNAVRRMAKLVNQNKYANRKLSQKIHEAKETQMKETLKEKVEDPAGEIFNTDREIGGEQVESILERIKGPQKRKGDSANLFTGPRKKAVPKY